MTPTIRIASPHRDSAADPHLKAASSRKVIPERIRLSLSDDPPDSMEVPLPSHRTWPVGIMMAVMFAIFASVAVRQIASLQGTKVDTVFDLAFVLFQGFWVLGCSVGVLILFLLTVLFFFYGESARITRGRLVYVPRLGPVKVLVEYDLARIQNPRLADSGASDRVQIRFDYGGGEASLGNEMPHWEAEGALHLIQAAIAQVPAHVEAGGRTEEPGFDLLAWIRRRSARPQRERPAQPVAPPDVSQSPAAASSSSLALIGANLIPLVGVVLLGWSLGEIMLLFWAENAVIGLYNLVKLGFVARRGIVFVGPFFAGHYGGFMTVHFLFVYAFFIRGFESTGSDLPVLAVLADIFVPLWPALLALLVGHGVSFYINFLGRREFEGRNVGQQMSEPYKRLVILHVTIIFGGWLIRLLKTPVPALILLIVLKTVVDLRAHRKEHRGKPRPHV